MRPPLLGNTQLGECVGALPNRFAADEEKEQVGTQDRVPDPVVIRCAGRQRVHIEEHLMTSRPECECEPLRETSPRVIVRKEDLHSPLLPKAQCLPYPAVIAEPDHELCAIAGGV